MLSSFDKKWRHFNVSGLSSDFVEVHTICGVFVFVFVLWAIHWNKFTYQIHKHHIFKLWTSWSYGSWIYNYLMSNQCLSPLKLWVRIPLMVRCNVLDRTLCDQVCQWLATGHGFLHQWNWPPKYNWNIVKSGVKDHYPKFKLGILGNYIYKIGGTQRKYIPSSICYWFKHLHDCE